MWLLPLLHIVSVALARTYYRLTMSGPAIPAGPVLIVANHPNGLLDPVLVAAAARRPVRLLAKAPLFDDRWIGWLIRAAGAIPVYRPSDDPASVWHNVETFDAVIGALAGGAAVGVFPEGRSHSEPELARLRTGAARMVLAAAHRSAVRPTIVPIGLVFRQKAVFRSRALAIRGEAIPWSDLAGRGSDDRSAVDTLTGRLDAGLRRVTVNTERWEDRPLVESAEAVWVATWGADSEPHMRVARLDTAASLLAQAKRRRETDADELATDLMAHVDQLRRLGLSPGSLVLDTGARAAVAWAVRRWYLVLAPTVMLALAAGLLFAVPYQVTDRVVTAFPDDEDVRSTYKVVAGAVVYGAWIVVLVGLAAWTLGGPGAVVTAVGLPAIAVAGLWAWERSVAAWADACRFFTVRRQAVRIADLRRDQAALADRLRQMYDELSG